MYSLLSVFVEKENIDDFKIKLNKMNKFEVRTQRQAEYEEGAKQANIGKVEKNKNKENANIGILCLKTKRATAK